MKTLVILQSNYIPWKGYFDLMAAADEFVLFDEAQFTKNDWRNRNRIVLAGKAHWLTIPVATAGRFRAPISEVEAANGDWARMHWETIRQAYRKAPHFAEMVPVIEAVYATAAGHTNLSEINALFLRHLAPLLGITTTLLQSDTVPRTTGDPTGRLVEICQARGATRYISGPAARAYIKTELFEEAGISLWYVSYDGYPVYDQAMEPFVHGVSLIDTLMRCGTSARLHLNSVSRPQSFLEPA